MGFVKRRQAMPRLEDQLHAIWLCVEIPYSGGRLVERGVEQLLKNQRDILCNVPLIVVLTKVDLLDIQLELEARDDEPAESRRKRHLDKHCIEPLQRAAERDVTCVAVSAIQGYYILISNLMVATQENMANNSTDRASRAMATIAQRVDIKEKIKMSIAVGKQEYWNSLLKSALFRGRTLKECLEVIRKDIVTIWNFVDLDCDLLDDELIKSLIPDNISLSMMRAWLPLADEQFLSDLVKNITGLKSAILNLRYESYKEAMLDVEIFMSYIVDLVCVMQVIFVLASDGLVTRDIVARATELSKDKREQVHSSIREFDKKRAIRAGQDLVLKEIETLIWRYRLSEQEMKRFKPYRKKTTHVEVEIACCNLVPTTDELIRLCPKFRLLVIGNSGVGKSTLIHKMFGVKVVHASDTVRWKADINQEFTSDLNERFVVHYSLGFEAGSEDNIDIVKTFVKERQAMPRLEDQLHAIWLCVEIPYSGGRFLEQGVEMFLQHRCEIIGNIPLTVVLTKLDLLDIQLELEGPGKGPLESRRSRRLEQHCIKPLHKVAGPDVVPVVVSGYYVPISNLSQATKENMAKHDIHDAPCAMASIAQRVNMKAKIETSIAVGKRQYWQNLQKSSSFYDHTLRACLDVIRKDIVTVWNLSGLDDCLMDDRLIEAFVSPDVLGDVDISQPTMGSLWRNLASEDSIPAAGQMVRSIMTDLLCKPYNQYQETVHGAEIFMSYIVNLTCVVQVIFLLAPDSVVKRECVDRAIDVCKDRKKQVNDTIKNFAEKRPIRNLGQDQVLKEIENLIWQYTSYSEVEQLRLQAVMSW